MLFCGELISVAFALREAGESIYDYALYLPILDGERDMMRPNHRVSRSPGQPSPSRVAQAALARPICAQLLGQAPTRLTWHRVLRGV